jgi:AraC family transcriptional regulator
MPLHLLNAHHPIPSEPRRPMRDTEHYANGVFDSTVASREVESPRASLLELALNEATPNELAVAAAQLVEAAHKARHGEREAAGVHIARAVELLQRKQSARPVAPPAAAKTGQATAGGLLAWQTRLLIAHINANLAQRIRVDELAALLGLSRSHFTRTFKRTFGVSPCTYLLSRRIEVAQGLLLTTCESVTSIALACGMYDQSHFTRAFRRVVGEAPYFWRRTRSSAFGQRRTSHTMLGLVGDDGRRTYRHPAWELPWRERI